MDRQEEYLNDTYHLNIPFLLMNVNKTLVYAAKCCLFVKKPTELYKNGAVSVDKIVLPVIINMSILFMKKENIVFFRAWDGLAYKNMAGDTNYNKMD